MSDRFLRHDSVQHVKTKNIYMVLMGPCDGLRLESTGEPAYLYQNFYGRLYPTVWVRSAVEMEDGRFEFKHRSTSGAGGRLPDA